MIGVVIGLHLLLGVVHTAPQELSAQESRFVGCYVLTMSPWRPEGASDPSFVVPQKVELTRRSGTESEAFGASSLTDWRILRAFGGAEETDHPWKLWRLDPKGHVELQWSSGFSGVSMELRERHGLLYGIAETFTDTSQEEHVADVEAKRVSCGTGR